MSRPASVFDLPDDFVLPPADELIRDRPTTWFGFPVEWLTSSSPVPVFMQKFGLAPDVGSTAVYLFAARLPVAEALFDGEAWADDGFLIEYFAIDKNPDGDWTAHRLRQRGHSVVHADRNEGQTDCVPAKAIDDPITLSIHEPPAWKLWVADWPTCDGKPMRFVGQVKPPDNDVTRSLLVSPWDVTIYLFCAPSDGGTRYKLVTQDRGAQTAEEHYELEEHLARND